MKDYIMLFYATLLYFFVILKEELHYWWLYAENMLITLPSADPKTYRKLFFIIMKYKRVHLNYHWKCLFGYR